MKLQSYGVSLHFFKHSIRYNYHVICFRLKLLKINDSKFLNLKQFTVVHKLNQLLVDSASDCKVTITSSFMVFFGPARNVNATGRITKVKVTTDRA